VGLLGGTLDVDVGAKEKGKCLRQIPVLDTCQWCWYGLGTSLLDESVWIKFNMTL
jgi:hypothetical protein